MSMAMWKKGLLFLLVVVAYTTCIAHGYSTWISNGASRSIVATTSYKTGKSKFINFVISPGTSQNDEYYYCCGTIHVELWVEGATHHNSVDIMADQSLVGYDHGGGSTGVDIYLAKYGTKFRRKAMYSSPSTRINGLANPTRKLE